jgi:hypothetical protein
MFNNARNPAACEGTLLRDIVDFSRHLLETAQRDAAGAGTFAGKRSPLCRRSTSRRRSDAGWTGIYGNGLDWRKQANESVA